MAGSYYQAFKDSRRRRKNAQDAAGENNPFTKRKDSSPEDRKYEIEPSYTSEFARLYSEAEPYETTS